MVSGMGTEMNLVDYCAAVMSDYRAAQQVEIDMREQDDKKTSPLYDPGSIMSQTCSRIPVLKKGETDK